MLSTELFYPQIAVLVGDYVLDQGVQIEVHSSKSNYFDWAKVRFTEQYQPKIALSRKAPAEIRLGYNGVYEQGFAGYVSRPYNSAGASNEVLLKDDMLRLEAITVTGTFLETTPQEMIRSFLQQAGITQMQLADTIYPERRRVPIREMSAVQAINAVHAAWGIKQPFFFSSSVFHWGTKPVQDRIYRFEYGVNILGLTRIGGMWELETVSAPFIKHSQRIIIEHPQISGTFEVSSVVFRTNDNGFIRTRISFSGKE